MNNMIETIRVDGNVEYTAENAEELLRVGKENSTTPADEVYHPTQEELDEYDSKQYQRDRATAYPSLQDQADMQFHDLANGTTTWLDAIQAVKDAYPKPI